MQYRNRYNKIFGGFIMRQACELAFTNTFLYAKHRPRLVNIDDIIFRRPVEIGSILRYTSHVINLFKLLSFRLLKFGL